MADMEDHGGQNYGDDWGDWAEDYDAEEEDWPDDYGDLQWEGDEEEEEVYDHGFKR